MKCIVYGLYSSRDNELRYIGQTTQDPRRRLSQHRNYAKRKRTAVHKWFLREMEEGFEVSLGVLCADAVFNETETTLIAKHREDGARLLNLTDGGEGTVGWRGNLGNKRPDLSERNRGNKVWLGRKHGPEARAKMSARLRGRSAPWLAERNKTNHPWVGKRHTPETKARMREAWVRRKTKTNNAQTTFQLEEPQAG